MTPRQVGAWLTLAERRRRRERLQDLHHAILAHSVAWKNPGEEIKRILTEDE